MTKVVMQTGSPVTPFRAGTVVGFVHVPMENKQTPLATRSPEPEPNIWAIVVDDLTGVFCAKRLYDITGERKEP
jgi:hypothetical protein